ncbi:MAG: NRDE family protein [Cyclobacteriaceae bacterium]|nr:NRDE family protein [Cyclobacteriaceae bacterium]
MCLIFISLNNHPRYKLILAGNRDEFYKRKTAAAHFWEDHPHIVGGRDLEANGTWLAMSTKGKLSMVTNYRDLKNLKPVAPSRGELVSEYLVNGDKPDNYLNAVAQKAGAYNGFNLLVGYPDALYYYSNYKRTIQKLTKGVHGLSNHLLDTPWPKVKRGKEKFSQAIADQEVDPEDLFRLLYDEERAPDSELPDTGIGLERERILSSMFIKSPDYGSRCSTVILVEHNNRVLFTERVYNTNTFDYQDAVFEFTIPGKG